MGLASPGPAARGASRNAIMPPDELTGVHIQGLPLVRNAIMRAAEIIGVYIQGLLLVVPQELIEPAPAARVLAAS